MSSQFRVPQTRAEADPRRWVALAVLLFANFMNLMDVTIVNVALPSLQADLKADASHLEWVVAAYVLSFALGLLPFGRLGDILGRTQMFITGVAAFSIASAACGLAPSIEWLIAARVLQGFAGAMMTPQVMAIAAVTFPPEERGQAFSLFGLSAGLAAVAGPIVGGLLIGANLGGLDWRPIFLVNVPVGILAVVLGWFLIPRPPGHRELKNDFVGIGLFGASMVALVFPLIEGRTYGWPLWSWVMIAAAIVGLGLFVLWEKRMAEAGKPQLLSFSLITNPSYMLGILVITVFASGIPGFFMVMSLLLQSGYDFTPLQSGLTNTPFSVGVLTVSLISGRFGQNYLRTRAAVSALLLTGGMFWLHTIIAGLGEEISQFWFLPPLFISGLGLGLGFSSLIPLVVSSVPARDVGAGSGAVQAFQQVGGAVGVALIGQIFFSSLDTAQQWGATSVREAFVGSASAATWYQVAVFGLYFLLVFLLRPRSSGEGGQRVAAPPVAMEA